MTTPTIDPLDVLDWDVSEYGRMRDYAVTPDQELITLNPEDYPRAFDVHLAVAVPDLPGALRRRGLQVEVVPGWETRSAGSFNPHGSVCHWTAGPAGSLSRPSLNVVVNGRTGLPGPLCNVYLDRYGVAVVVSVSRANHAGLGDWRGLSGNSSVWGTEAESAGPNDWTKEQRKAYSLVNAAYADLSGFADNMVCGHSEWADVTAAKDGKVSRKSDINGYTMIDMRAAVASHLRGSTQPQKGFLMALNDQQQDELYNWVKELRTRVRGPESNTSDMLQRADDALFGHNEPGRNNFHWAEDNAAARQEALLAKLAEIEAEL